LGTGAEAVRRGGGDSAHPPEQGHRQARRATCTPRAAPLNERGTVPERLEIPGGRRCNVTTGRCPSKRRLDPGYERAGTKGVTPVTAT
jgi:hypothetical protein